MPGFLHIRMAKCMVKWAYERCKSAPIHTHNHKILLLLVVLLLGFIPSAYAQNRGSVNGFVYDTETDVTLPGAHVYLANTTIGDITNPDGFFKIEDVQAGAYQIIVTIIGYKPLQQPIEILPGLATDLTLKLEKDVYSIGEITVTDNQPKGWKRELTRFERMFLGITSNRRGCEIENPFVMSFEKTNHVFTASASAPLTIINRSIGYEVTYHLSEFSADGNQFRFMGQPVFIELEPKNDKEARKWEKRRKEAYAGSFRHFLRSLAAGTSYEEGFRLYLLDTLYWQKPHTHLMDFFGESGAALNHDSLMKEHPLPHERSMVFSGYLHIFYLNEMMERDFYEWIAMPYNATKEPVRAVLRLIHLEANFNEIGYLNNAFNVARYGYWNWESGICNWLPFNYGLEPAAE